MKLSHINSRNQPAMVDVGGKKITRRFARARATVFLPDAVAEKLSGGDIAGPKGPVFQTAIIAGTMAAKRTAELIPLCHPLPVEKIVIKILPKGKNEVLIECEVSVQARTGVEMEALTGASIAALTVYDMCKALSHGIIIRDVRLVEKRGGKNDFVA